MAEKFNACPWLTINASGNLADHLVSAPMLDDSVRPVPLTPSGGYTRSGGVLHDAVFRCELYADDAANSVTQVLLGVRGDDTMPGIRGTKVRIAVQRELTSTGTAGEASSTDPICDIEGTCYSIPEYEGGPFGDATVFVLVFAVQGAYNWRTSGAAPTG